MLSRTPSGRLPKKTSGYTPGGALNTDHWRCLDDPALVVIDLCGKCDTLRVVVVQTAGDAIQGRLHPIESASRVVLEALKAGLDSLEPRVVRVETLIEFVELALQLSLHVREHRRECGDVLVRHFCCAV